MGTSDDDDGKLTGYLDGELDDGERAALEARLDADPGLRARLDALRVAADRTRLAFAALLETAPIAGMRRGSTPRLPPLRRAPRRAGASASPRSPPRPRSSLSPPASAPDAGAPGPATGSPSDDWRQSVVEYMALYTSDSFGKAASPKLADQLATLSQRLGAPLDVERLQLDGLSLHVAEPLQYDGAPLGEIGYLDGATPVAFCILRDGEADAPLASSSRNGFAVASWAQGGRGFMLIGKIPAERLTTLARSLKGRTG